MSQGVKHAAHLPLSTFGNHHHNAASIAATLQIENLRRSRFASVDKNTRLEAFTGFGARMPLDFDEVLLFNLVTGMTNTMIEIAIVSKEKQTLGVLIQTSDRNDPIIAKTSREQIHDRKTVMRVVSRSDDSGGLVKKNRHPLQRLDEITVDHDLVFFGVDSSAKGRGRLAVHLHTAGLNQKFSSTSRSVTAVRDVFVDAHALGHERIIAWTEQKSKPENSQDSDPRSLAQDFLDLGVNFGDVLAVDSILYHFQVAHGSLDVSVTDQLTRLFESGIELRRDTALYHLDLPGKLLLKFLKRVPLQIGLVLRIELRQAPEGHAVTLITPEASRVENTLVDAIPNTLKLVEIHGIGLDNQVNTLLLGLFLLDLGLSHGPVGASRIIKEQADHSQHDENRNKTENAKNHAPGTHASRPGSRSRPISSRGGTLRAPPRTCRSTLPPTPFLSQTGTSSSRIGHRSLTPLHRLVDTLNVLLSEKLRFDKNSAHSRSRLAGSLQFIRVCQATPGLIFGHTPGFNGYLAKEQFFLFTHIQSSRKALTFHAKVLQENL